MNHISISIGLSRTKNYIDHLKSSFSSFIVDQWPSFSQLPSRMYSSLHIVIQEHNSFLDRRHNII